MPVAIDTNVLVRFITRDNAAQERAARALFARSVILVGATVVMETEWVLRRSYQYSRDRIASVLDVLLDNEGVVLDEPDRIQAALQAYRKGLDFADALHLTGCGKAEVFATFDRSLARRAANAFTRPRVVAP